MDATLDSESAGADRYAPHADDQGHRIWTAERAALHRWLERTTVGLAPMYEAAVRMVMDETFPARVPLVAHCVREIRNRLPDALLGPVANSRTEYSELASAIHARWVEDGWPPDGVARSAAGAEPSSAGPIRPEVSPELLRAVGDLVVGHVAASENYRGRARRFLEVVGGAAPPNYVVQAWVQGSKWAVKLAHVRTTPLPAEHEVDLASKFLVFEQALMVISNRSYENMDALDEILDAANR